MRVPNTAAVAPAPIERPPHALAEVARLMFRLGWTAFGGPAAHLAMLREEVVTRRAWVTDADYLDMIGAANLIPGPNSTEVVMHTGYRRAGWPGLFVGGTLFILPAATLVLACAWLYEQFGTTVGGGWILYGIKPVIIAVIAQAIWGLAKTAVKNVFLGAVGAAVLALYLLGVNEILLLFGGAIFVALAVNARRIRAAGGTARAVVPLPLLFVAVAGGLGAERALQIFLSFLKIGAVLYGSGYVLLAFLRAEFVERLGWVTNPQLLDAVAVGQFTPGPVFTTATFIGYLVGGWGGAALATVGIFLPAFVFVALSVPLLPKLRKSPWTAALLDGVNVAALGLMAAVLLDIARAALVDWVTVGLAIGAAVLLIRFRVNSVWLILGGAAIGAAYRAVAG